jgi:protein-tyrosine-phosphatase
VLTRRRRTARLAAETARTSTSFTIFEGTSEIQRDACPLLPGKHYEDWELEDPAGKTPEEIRPIRDEIKDRVANLLEKLASM